MVFVVKTADTDDGRRFIATVEDLFCGGSSKRVAFDCEGVNLSRIGTLELVSVCFPNMEVYLIDFGGTVCSRVSACVKHLFESGDVVKIVHDCRMDCDALYHLHGIALANVHDTSCFHHVITGAQDKNLNDVLSYNGIALNGARDKSVYQNNPNFWSSRPLTQRMIDWASSDVNKLFTLADAQLARITGSSRAVAISKSSNYASSVRSMQIRTGLKVRRPGPFIGHRGQNIRSLQDRTGTVIYQDRERGTWFVYYANETSLNAVMQKMSS